MHIAQVYALSPSPFLADLDAVLLCLTIFRCQLVSNPFARIPLAIWRCPWFFLSFPGHLSLHSGSMLLHLLLHSGSMTFPCFGCSFLTSDASFLKIPASTRT